MSIKHPSDWEITGFDRTTRDDRIGLDIFAVLCPKSVLVHPFNDSFSQCPTTKEVMIAVANLPKNTTLEEYVNNTSGSKFSFTDYKLGRIENTTLAGLPAKKVIYSYLGEYLGQDRYIQVQSVITISGNRGYDITYYSPRLEFDDLMPQVQQIFDSLRIFPMPPCNFIKDNPQSSEGKCVLKPLG